MTDTQTTTTGTGTSAPAKKTAAKKTAAKKTATKKAAAKKTAAKAAAKKTATKKAPAKKTAAKRTSTKKTSTRTPAKATSKSPARKTASPTGSRAARAVEAGRTLVGRATERVGDLGRAVAPSSTFFARAPLRARELAADPEALRGLADRALHSASGRTGPVGEVADELRTLGRLVAAYARGDYRDIPLDSLIMVIAGLVYVVSPLDLIPDFVPVAGYADDAVAVGFVIRQVHHELAAFKAWEAGEGSGDT